MYWFIVLEARKSQIEGLISGEVLAVLSMMVG
jgi:hypothetical protein